MTKRFCGALAVGLLLTATSPASAVTHYPTWHELDAACAEESCGPAHPFFHRLAHIFGGEEGRPRGIELAKLMFREHATDNPNAFWNRELADGWLPGTPWMNAEYPGNGRPKHDPDEGDGGFSFASIPVPPSLVFLLSALAGVGMLGRLGRRAS